MSSILIKDIRVDFKAIAVESGTGPLDIRVLIPKGKYRIVAEDDGYYYLQPTAAITRHAMAKTKS